MVRARVAESPPDGPVRGHYNGSRMEAGLEALVRSQVPAGTACPRRGQGRQEGAGRGVRGLARCAQPGLGERRPCAGHVDAVVAQVAKAVVKLAASA